MFTLEDIKYNWQDLEKVIDPKDFDIVRKKGRSKDKTGAYNVACAFDIEASSWYLDGKKCACMYVWMFGINGRVFVGRTWAEFLEFIRRVRQLFELSDNLKLIVYVHNLAYDWQFFRKYFEVVDLFALEQRKVIYAKTKDGIEFRCSYMLTAANLDTVGKNLQRYKVTKRVGDLDYSKKRFPCSYLNAEEWGYCIADVLVVMAHIQECIEDEGTILQIPLTKTGYARRHCRNFCLYNEDKKEAQKYRKTIQNLTLTPEEYELAKQAFAGGFTHAGHMLADETLENVASYDFTSSYPAVMCTDVGYPMGKGWKELPKNRGHFDYLLTHFACLMDITLYDVREKFIFDHIISKSRCLELEGARIDNGRVIEADKVRLCCTDVDFRELLKFYNFSSSFDVNDFWCYERAPLPKLFVECVLQLYADKTQLKGVDGREVDYNLAKGLLNSLYGMTVTDICKDAITYDEDEWGFVPVDLGEALNGRIDEKTGKRKGGYNYSHTRFTSYLWGVWITAYARRNLHCLILESGQDHVYSDTDSEKFLNIGKHKAFYDEYNAVVSERITATLESLGICPELANPADIHGERHLLGSADFEGIYSKFKTLGAKRYMVENGKGLNITISGVNKKKAVPWLKDTFEDAFEVFEDGLIFPAEHTGKLTHTYIDDIIEVDDVDDFGNSYHIKEASAVHMEPAAYHMSLDDTYLDYLEELFNEFNF